MDQTSDEHAILVHIALSDDFASAGGRLRLWRLERRLEKAISRADAGEFDGDEFGEGEAIFYLYGPDMERMWQAVEPVLRSSRLRPAYVLLRAGARMWSPDAWTFDTASAHSAGRRSSGTATRVQ